MREIVIEREDVNIEALDDALHTALGAVYIGLSTRPNTLILHLTDASTVGQRAQARQIALDHDATQLTVEQQRRVFRRQQLAQLRAQNASDIDPADYASESPSVLALAQKIAWLEQELRELRNQ